MREENSKIFQKLREANTILEKIFQEFQEHIKFQDIPGIQEQNNIPR